MRCKFVGILILVLFGLALAQTTQPARLGSFDPAKCGPMVHDLKVWDPAATATLENYLCGGFIATQGPGDAEANPPRVHDGKGILCRIRTTWPGDVITFRNCGGWDIGRENKLIVVNGKQQWIATHTDWLFVVSDKAATGVTLRIVDCYVGHVEGETIHIEGGSFASIELVRVVTRNFRDGKPVAANKVTIKLQSGCKIGRVVLDSCETNLYFDTTPLNGADPGSVVGAVYVNRHAGTFPTKLGSAKVVVNDLPADMKPATQPVVTTAPATKPATMPMEQRDLVIDGKHYRVVDE